MYATHLLYLCSAKHLRALLKAFKPGVGPEQSSAGGLRAGRSIAGPLFASLLLQECSPWLEISGHLTSISLQPTRYYCANAPEKSKRTFSNCLAKLLFLKGFLRYSSCCVVKEHLRSFLFLQNSRTPRSWFSDLYMSRAIQRWLL